MLKNSLLALHLAGLAVTTALVPVSAQTLTDNFSGVDTLVLRDFIATVSIVTGEGPEISVSVMSGEPETEPVLVRSQGNKVEVYSEDRPDQKTFWNRMNWHRDGDNAFRVFLREYPVVQIAVPEGTKLVLDGLAADLTVGDLNGDIEILSTLFVEGKVGNMRNADIRITGSGDIDFTSVSDRLDAKIAGSGTLSFLNVSTAELGIAGSGDIDIAQIDGPLIADIRGSGDIDLGNITGDSELRIAGSGNINTGRVDGGTDISIRGSGDIMIDELNGPSAVSITGNGDVEIRGGRAENFKVQITGSGDLEFIGIAVNPDIQVTGSGDVYIREYEGSVRTRGNGDITIGEINIEN